MPTEPPTPKRAPPARRAAANSQLLPDASWVESSGLRLKRCAPHSRQKNFSSPCSNRNVRPSIRACAEAARPVRRWQRVQGQ
jgi:hypothetical protein